ncbi:MAG TPA: NAD(P)H-dependent oxidoreductase [Steroidobacteraceae bacterium]
MGRRILIIDGHPDARAERFIHALAQAYGESAEQAGHEIRQILISELNFPLLRRSEDFENGIPPPVIRRCQEAIAWADHLLILLPLWLGSMPALFYRWYFRAHSLKSLARNILGFCGIGPIRQSLIGMIATGDSTARQQWLGKMRTLGSKGQ